MARSRLLPDEDKVAFDLSAQENLQMALLGVFDSQISGGKRYDLATMGDGARTPPITPPMLPT